VAQWANAFLWVFIVGSDKENTKYMYLPPLLGGKLVHPRVIPRVFNFYLLVPIPEQRNAL